MEIMRFSLSSDNGWLFFYVDDGNYLAFINDTSIKKYSLYTGCEKEHLTWHYIYYPSACERRFQKSRFRGITFFSGIFSVQFKTQKRRQNED